MHSKGRRSAPKKNGSRATAPERGSGAQTVYGQMRKAILDLSLEPGSPLDEVGLAAEFKMSRTPIREALVRLATEGLVLTLPNRNTIVTPIDFVRMPAYFEALSLMYRVTTRTAAVHHMEHHLPVIRQRGAEYAEAVVARDALLMIETNRNFHVAIAEAGANSYFTTFFARLLDEGRRILRLYYRSFEDVLPYQYVAEHEGMVEAIAARDADLAERLAGQHAVQIVRQIQGFMARDTTRDLSLVSAGRS